MTRWLVASLHLLALPVGFWAVLTRGAALRGPLDRAGLRRAFTADAVWGIAALVWVSTGVARAFFGLEKGTAYYLASTAFWLEMAFLLVILMLEARPVTGLIRWRIAHGRGEPVDTGRALLYARMSHVQAGLLILDGPGGDRDGARAFPVTGS